MQQGFRVAQTPSHCHRRAHQDADLVGHGVRARRLERVGQTRGQASGKRAVLRPHRRKRCLEQLHHDRVDSRHARPFGAIGQCRLGQLVGSSQSSRNAGRANAVGATFGDRSRSDQSLTPDDVQPTPKLGRVGAECQQAALTKLGSCLEREPTERLLGGAERALCGLFGLPSARAFEQVVCHARRFRPVRLRYLAGAPMQLRTPRRRQTFIESIAQQHVGKVKTCATDRLEHADVASVSQQVERDVVSDASYLG